eukprot:CAMPEP_0201536160 /NCGR_PEP_ID=MMETSP0161_2-20130828/61112_1 /ASSEMBLY_ACC=CAM_ASM_000251 /TAXON_ID=180227 /ORGANISM="Neoparamoeba aestuarina, Strain SoJaBio B1-5/56/2" /LENGTH=75 /DNA_ID=CAMNT_0047941699 /DNA_START=36 /DNA_END=259 /DNA_ORIENTATION=+
MELLFRNTDGIPEGLSDINELYGLEFDENREIIAIQWFEHRITGTMDFHWLPQHLQSLNLSANLLKGTLDFADFP